MIRCIILFQRLMANIVAGSFFVKAKTIMIQELK